MTTRLGAVGRERNQHRQADLHWAVLTERASPVDAYEVEQGVK
jgi:hypothetical protein